MENSVYKLNWEDNSGIKVFIDAKNLFGDNRKFAELYNKIKPFYYISQKIFYKIKFGGEHNFRKDFLKNIVVNNNDLVLKTSIGTADNLYYMNKNAKYYGVDISIEMLKRAKRHVKSWQMNVELICCEAENLPFMDNMFNVVYSCGGFNF